MALFKKSYHRLSDEQLMPLIAKGRERAFEELYNRYHQRMYNYFYRMLAQKTEYANDATQELFIKVFQNAYRFQTDKKCSTWLYAIASNLCKNEYRRWSKRPILRELTQEDDRGIQEQFSEGSDQLLFQEHLQLALDSLEYKHRKCFILRFQEERSIREISEITQCPEGTIKSRIHYCLKKLAPKLKLFDPNQNELDWQERGTTRKSKQL